MEEQHEVVRVADTSHWPSSPRIEPRLHFVFDPAIEHLVEENVRKQRRDNAALRCAFVKAHDASLLQHSRIEPSVCRLVTRRNAGLPGSWRTLADVPRSMDPGEAATTWSSSLLVSPSAQKTASAFSCPTFRGWIARPVCSLSTLRSSGHPETTQDSLAGADHASDPGLVTR